MLSDCIVEGFRFLHIRPQHVSKITYLLVAPVAYCMILNLTKIVFFPFTYQLQNPNALVLAILSCFVRSISTLPRIAHYGSTWALRFSGEKQVQKQAKKPCERTTS